MRGLYGQRDSIFNDKTIVIDDLKGTIVIDLIIPGHTSWIQVARITDQLVYYPVVKFSCLRSRVSSSNAKSVYEPWYYK